GTAVQKRTPSNEEGAGRSRQWIGAYRGFEDGERHWRHAVDPGRPRGFPASDRGNAGQRVSVSEPEQGRPAAVCDQSPQGVALDSEEGAGATYFTLCELRHAFATRLSAGGMADHMVTQMLRQSDADVFKLYSQAKLGMMREALAKLDRRANERESTERVS